MLEMHEARAGVQPAAYLRVLKLTGQHPPSTRSAGSAPCISGLGGSTLPALPSLPRDDLSA